MPDIHETLDKIMMCIELAEIMEPIQAGLKDKAPAIKKNTGVFLEKTILVTYIDTLEDLEGQILPVCFDVSEEKDNDVREQGLRLLGVLQGRLGEGKLSPYTEKLIPQKKAKVEETAKEVKPSKYDKSAKKAAAAEAAKKKAAAAEAKKKAAAPPKKKPAAMTFDDKEEIKNDGGDEPMDFSGPPKSSGPPKKVPGKPPNIGQKPEKKAPPTLSSAAPKKAGGGSGKGSSAPQVQEEDLGSGLSKEEAIDKVTEFYDAGHVKNFEEAKWQTKQEGFKGLQS